MLRRRRTCNSDELSHSLANFVCTEASYPHHSDEVNENSSPEPWTTILGPCTKGQQNSDPHDAPQHRGSPKHKPRNTHRPCLSRCCYLPFQANAITHRTTLLGPWFKGLCAGNKCNGTRPDIFYHTMYIGAAHPRRGAKCGGGGPWWGASRCEIRPSNPRAARIWGLGSGETDRAVGFAGNGKKVT